MTPKKQAEPVAVEPQTKRVSDVVWQALIAGIVTCVLAGIQVYAARKVEQVRVDLKTSTADTTEKLDEIAEVGNQTHVLVNSSMTAQLKISALALRRISVLTNDPEDEAAAALAEKLLKEHSAKQKTVDDGNKL